MSRFGAPVRVSPLIKFARWSLLTAGIFYGSFKQKLFHKKAVKEREAEHQKKVVRDAKFAVQKKIADEFELRELEAMFK